MNKGKWGGQRTPGPGKKLGRPTMEFGKRLLVLDCTEAEKKEIEEALPDTRQRVEILLAAIRHASP